GHFRATSPAATLNSPPSTSGHQGSPACAAPTEWIKARTPSRSAQTANTNTSASRVMPGRVIARIPKRMATTPRSTNAHQFRARVPNTNIAVPPLQSFSDRCELGRGPGQRGGTKCRIGAARFREPLSILQGMRSPRELQVRRAARLLSTTRLPLTEATRLRQGVRSHKWKSDDTGGRYARYAIP